MREGDGRRASTVRGRRDRGSPAAGRGPGRVLAALAVLLWSPTSICSSQSNIRAVLDFDSAGLPAGSPVCRMNGDANGTPVGPVVINGIRPTRPDANYAVLFDSSSPTGNNFDLGTPNQLFGGAGIGDGGGPGPFQNDTPLFNILIVSRSLDDANLDGLIDDPASADEDGMTLVFDFSSITVPFAPARVSILEIATIDVGDTEPLGHVELLDDSGPIDSFELVPVPDNGVLSQILGTPGQGIPGVKLMRVQLFGVGALDNIVFAITPPPPNCLIEPPGPFETFVGETVTFLVTGEAQGAGFPVTLVATRLPLGAIMAPPLPLGPRQLVMSTFAWTPTAADVGTHPVAFTVTDSMIGQARECSTWIEVAPSCIPVTTLVCSSLGEDVTLSWVNGDTYSAIEVFRDSELLEALGGNATSLADLAVSAGTYTYEVKGECRSGNFAEGIACEVLHAPVGEPAFLRGDCNGDGAFDGLLDGLRALQFQFMPGTPAPPCLAGCDANGNHSFDGLGDALYILNFQFAGGAPPAPPFPVCGFDPTTTARLGCEIPAACP